MDLLKTIAFPQPQEHYHLLLLVLAIVFVIQVPYTAFVAGSSLLSLLLRRKGGERLAARFSSDLMEIALHDRRLPLFFGVLPAFALVFVYAQLLQGTPAIAVGLMAFASLLLTAGFVLLLAYRDALRWDRLVKAYGAIRPADDPGLPAVVAASAEANEAARLRGGRNGLLLLLAGVYLATGAAGIAAVPESWEGVGSLLALLLTAGAWLKFLIFLALSSVCTGIGMLFFFLVWEGGRPGMEAEYRSLVQRTGVRLAAIGLLALPALLLLEGWYLPPQSVSGLYYALLASGIVLLFLAGNFVYSYTKRAEVSHAAYAFYVLACALFLLMVNDHIAIGNATRSHSVRLAALHERATEELKAKLGIGKPAATGEDIYNGKCSACHMFDKKKVGPPYQEVLPKYAGKKAELIAFVLNPRTINPAYPPMPNQGLKPAEADSIASYLLGKVAPSVPAARK